MKCATLLLKLKPDSQQTKQIVLVSVSVICIQRNHLSTATKRLVGLYFACEVSSFICGGSTNLQITDEDLVASTVKKCATLLLKLKPDSQQTKQIVLVSVSVICIQRNHLSTATKRLVGLYFGCEVSSFICGGLTNHQITDEDLVAATVTEYPTLLLKLKSDS